MGGQIKDKEQPYATNRINVIGNIVPNQIVINEEKGYAKYLIMISSKSKEGEKEKKPEFYNFIHTIKDKDDATLNTLKQIQEQGVGKQVKVKGSISYSKNVNEQTGEVKYYNNFNAYSIQPTVDFLIPKANIELTGLISKPLSIKEIAINNPDNKDNKKFASLSIITLEGSEGKITKFHNISTSQYTLANNSEFLSSIKKGEQISLQGRLSGNGNIQLAKDSQVFKGINFESAMLKDSKSSKEMNQER
ncbi:Single-stranded DNA-binding protein [Candidatus Hepatincola sp. Av]